MGPSRPARGSVSGASKFGPNRSESVDESAGERDATPETETDAPDWFDSGDLESQADVVAELDLTPAEFVVRLLRDYDGRLRQQQIADYTAWSEGTVCRVLDTAESDGHVVRVRIGRENVVYLPEKAPKVRSTDDDRTG